MSSSASHSLFDGPLSSATNWLSRSLDAFDWHQSDRSSLTSLYKAPLALRLVGANKQFDQVIKYLQHHLIIDGRLHEPDTAQEYLSYCPNYRNSWVAVAAPSLLRILPDPGTIPRDIDLLSLACLSLVARSMGQSEFSATLAGLILPYVSASSPGRIVLRRISDAPLETADDARRWSLVSADTYDPKTYIPALSIVALVEAFRASGDRAYMNAAQSFWSYLSPLGDALFLGDYVGKIGIASAQLFLATGDNHFMTTAIRAAEHLMSWQTDEGCVLLPHRHKSLREQPPSMTLDRTSEYIVALSGIRALLA